MEGAMKAPQMPPALAKAFLLLCLGVLGAVSQVGAAAAAGTTAKATEALATVKPRSSSRRGMGAGFYYTRNTGRCTPQFWSSRQEAWPRMAPQESSLSKVFGSTALERYEPGLTLLEATQRNDDVGGSPFSQLLKQSAAALLNSYTRQGYPFAAWEVKTLLIQSLVSEDAAATQAQRFKEANEACN